MTTRRSVLGCRETSGPPEVLHGALVSVGRPRCESVARIWEHTRCGCTQFDWVAEVGQTHRASSTSGGRKTCWRTRALARKKSVAPPDAGRGWAEGEPVRVREAFKQVCSTCDLRVSTCRALDTTEGVLGLYARLALTGRTKHWPSDSEVNSTSANGPQGYVLMLDSASGGHGFRLGRAFG